MYRRNIIVLLILVIFQESDYINDKVQFEIIMWTFYYTFYVVLSRSLGNFGVYFKIIEVIFSICTVFILETQIHLISVVLLHC